MGSGGAAAGVQTKSPDRALALSAAVRSLNPFSLLADLPDTGTDQPSIDPAFQLLLGETFPDMSPPAVPQSYYGGPSPGYKRHARRRIFTISPSP